LIAEDNSVNQKVLKRMLETIGYSDITIAWNGKEAVDSVVESWDGYLACSSSSAAVVSLFDIVLMDCMMPEMDGWEATREIRKLEKDMLSKAATLSGDSPGYSNVKPTVVIALTANATEEDKIKCNEAGMDDFYVKPMNIDGVQAMMLHWVSKLFSDSSVRNDLEFE
jgi:CheY-like chemotaxis protein